MAEFKSTIESMFDGMESFVKTKTVTGDPICVDGATYIPFIEVSCGLAAGAFSKSAKENGAGGMAAKMTPVAILCIQDNGATKLINIKNQDALSKVIDMIPEVINKFTGNDKPLSPKTEAKGQEIANEQGVIIEKFDE